MGTVLGPCTSVSVDFAFSIWPTSCMIAETEVSSVWRRRIVSFRMAWRVYMNAESSLITKYICPLF